jgi:hypothetical protein
MVALDKQISLILKKLLCCFGWALSNRIIFRTLAVASLAAALS